MSHVRDFFYDRFVLFMLTINSFLTVVTILSVLLRLGNSEGIYVHSYRSNLGLGGIEAGGVSEIISFIVFAVGIFAVHILLAIKFYKIRKSSSWAVLILTSLLLIMNLIVANSLLDLS
jgi:hypothetical protein